MFSIYMSCMSFSQSFFSFFFFFSSRRRHTRSCLVSWARRCVQETGTKGGIQPQSSCCIKSQISLNAAIDKHRNNNMWIILWYMEIHLARDSFTIILRIAGMRNGKQRNENEPIPRMFYSSQNGRAVDFQNVDFHVILFFQCLLRMHDSPSTLSCRD
eukprot:TRINITY_DN37315_c0_g1_i1.p1 TRINITY_DN37315_c0_g1~~TRINITY_DN37315_c0_g1_i1.p1  ORF type:complete len:157 (+),score=8.91 TRINITY_DN37315_c0_g1_i1:40-510(+)